MVAGRQRLGLPGPTCPSGGSAPGLAPQQQTQTAPPRPPQQTAAATPLAPSPQEIEARAQRALAANAPFRAQCMAESQFPASSATDAERRLARDFDPQAGVTANRFDALAAVQRWNSASAETRNASTNRQAYWGCLMMARARHLRGSSPPPAQDGVAYPWQFTNALSREQFGYQRERQQQRPYHNGANDATECMRVFPTETKLEWGINGKVEMINTCPYPVSVTWCANERECNGGAGSTWILRAGQQWPIFFADPVNTNIRIGACRIGANATPTPQPGQPLPPDRHLPPAAGSAPGVEPMTNNYCD